MLSERPWNLVATMWLFAMVFATLCLAMISTSVIELLKLGGSEDQRRFLEMVIMGLSFQVGALIWIWIYVREAGISLKEAFGFSSGSPVRAVVLGLAAGILFLPFAWGTQQICFEIMTWLHLDPNPQAVVEELSGEGLSIWKQLFFGVISIILAPVAEESFFRGIIYPTVKQAGFPRLALWGTAVLFGLFHINVVTFVPLALFGVALSLLYEKTNNLLTPICAHSIFNTINFFLLIFQEPLSRLFK